MDAVLGFSVTPSGVGVVLVDDRAGSGNDSGYEVRARAADSALATAAVRRAEAMAADRGCPVRSVAVTWSENADREATQWLAALSDSGFGDAVAVHLSEAADTLARALANMTGYPTTAVCVVEPGQLIALVVNTAGATVQTAVEHAVVTEDDLIGWLQTVFTRAGRAPDVLVLVGSAEDLDGLAPVLQDALSMPVFAPEEAALALARGAAMSCTRPARRPGNTRDHGRRPVSPPPSRRAGQVIPAAMLATGLVTFVASLSAAVTLQFGSTPDRPQLAAENPGQTPAVFSRPAPTPRPAATASVTAVPPAATVPVQEFAPPPGPAAAEAPVADIDSAPIFEAAAEQLAPEPAAVPGTETAVEAAPALDDPPPAPLAPEALPAPPPQEEPGLMQRIRDRLSGIGDDEPPPPAAVAPAPPP